VRFNRITHNVVAERSVVDAKEKFDLSASASFFWNSTDLFVDPGSDGTWKIVNAACPSTWAGPSKTCRVALH